MKIIHAVIRKLRPCVRHPDGVRDDLGDQMQGIFGLASPPHDALSLRCRPTREEVARFQDLPEERQLEALNTYLRMVEEFTRWDRPAGERFVLTLQNGRLKFVDVPSKSVGSEPQAAGTRLQVGGDLLKDFALQSFEAVLVLCKSVLHRHGKDGV
ncbi:hypothetical protein [Gluconobacter oxydans]|uniref:hypothetical protein n=1 Tax=Gluconobacter oxydans TaxID=442 RepID=UPI0039ED7AA0